MHEFAVVLRQIIFGLVIIYTRLDEEFSNLVLRFWGEGGKVSILFLDNHFFGGLKILGNEKKKKLLYDWRIFLLFETKDVLSLF